MVGPEALQGGQMINWLAIRIGRWVSSHEIQSVRGVYLTDPEIRICLPLFPIRHWVVRGIHLAILLVVPVLVVGLLDPEITSGMTPGSGDQDLPPVIPNSTLGGAWGTPNRSPNHGAGSFGGGATPGPRNQDLSSGGGGNSGLDHLINPLSQSTVLLRPTVDGLPHPSLLLVLSHPIQTMELKRIWMSGSHDTSCVASRTLK